jgi:cytochrome c6
MKKQRVLLLVLGAIALGLLASACGSSGSSSSASSTSSSAASAPPATTSATSSTAATTSSTAASTSSTSTAASAPASGVSAAAGKTVFASTCGACHTLAAAGTHGMVGPDLDQVTPSDACVVQQVTDGGAVKPPCPAIAGAIMPSFAHTLSQGQIHSVALFVSSEAGKVKGTTSTTSGGGLP